MARFGGAATPLRPARAPPAHPPLPTTPPRLVYCSLYPSPPLLVTHMSLLTTLHSGDSNSHWACGKNALPCVRALIKSGADVDASDWAGRTPIHWAVLVDASESASELLQAGANASLADRDQRTPLHWAADRASEACVKLC